MKYHLLMPLQAGKHYDEWIEDGHLADIARLAEQAGFGAVGTTDHPFPDNDWLANGGHHSFDPFVALSFMAAATSRVQLLTFVLVAGYRNPYITAKSLASLDRLSGGRVIAGMAAGYLRTEFEAVGASWIGRGQLFDAALEAMRQAWSGQPVELDGPHGSHEHSQLPKPARDGGPPIWIGGNSDAARRRAVTAGDGWLPLGQSAGTSAVTQTPALTTIDELGRQISEMNRSRSELEKPPLEVCFSPFGDTRDLVGYTKRILADLPAYERAGVTWLTLQPRTRNLTEFRDAVARLSDEVVALS